MFTVFINLQKQYVFRYYPQMLQKQQYSPYNNHYSVDQRCLTGGVLSEQNAPIGCIIACSTNKAQPCNNKPPTCNCHHQQIQQYQRFQVNRVNRAIRVKQLNQANVHKILTNILLYLPLTSQMKHDIITMEKICLFCGTQYTL